MYKKALCWLFSLSLFLVMSNTGSAQILISDNFDGGGLGAGDGSSVNGGFTLTANSISAASATAEADSYAEVVTTGGANGNAGICSNTSFDSLSAAAMSKGLTVEWVVTSLSQTTNANGNTFTLQRDNVFFNTLPYVGVMFSGKAGTIPDGVRFVGKNNTTGGPTHNLSELYNYDQASFLDGFTVRFTINETGWAFQVEGLDIDVAEEGSWPADFALTDVLDGDSFVSAHAQTPGADLTARYDSCEVWIGKKDASRANTPQPENQTEDVLRDAVLAWNAGEFAAAHDVYVGVSFDDVNDADRANPLGVLVSQGQVDAAYDLPGLEFGQTYYWRVDEVNAAPDNTIFKGDLWSFTTELFAYPIENVTATSNGVSEEGVGPENTVDGSGLDADDQHSVESADMWTATLGDEPLTIQFEFDRVHKLHQMLVWNYNVSFEPLLGFGVKDVTIEYSTDGIDWTVLGDVVLAQATAFDTYTANTTIDFPGAAVKVVKLTVNNAYGDSGKFGLSEVRFLSIPVQAAEPQPADGAADVTVSDVNLSWKAGREATGHDVYLSTDPNALTLIDSVSDNTVDPGALDLGTAYYWKIDEVNEAEEVSTWEGDIWSFTTQALIVVEDFESYTDDIEASEAIFLTWVDGYEMAGNNSQVGYLEAPFAEDTIVHGGGQSMPLIYDNTDGGISETTLTFDVPQDWSANAIQTLSLFVYGDGANSGGQLYLKINNAKVSYAYLADVLQRQQWVSWTIDLASTGANLSSVTSVTLGIDGAGASGMIFVDDMCLYPQAVELIEPVLPPENDPNLVAHYEFESNANDSRGNYHGAAEGTPAYATGKVGQAISLDKDDDHIVNDFDDVVWPAFSVSLWVKTDVTNQVNYSGLFNNNSAGADFQLDVDGTDPGNYKYQGGNSRVLGPVINDWVHLAVSCDGAGTSLYYNGLIVATVNAVDNVFGQIAIGINRGMSTRFGGMIDEVRLYNRAISEAEVLGLAGVTESVPKSL